jgi:colanic acid/amylovoran biosynthesis glycosyltransferase
MDEIAEIRRRGVVVIPFSSKRSKALNSSLKAWASETVYLWPLRLTFVIAALWLCIQHITVLFEILRDAFFAEHQSITRRAKALTHSFLGAYLAVLLQAAKVDHIHVHHGYFSAWVAMAAARLCRVPYSITLHGSDLLLNSAFIGTKLAHCDFCTTVSEFNRKFILDKYPAIHPARVLVQHVGVDTTVGSLTSHVRVNKGALLLLSVGRLHQVKNHAFLLNACASMKRRGQRFACLIAGEGKERGRLSSLVRLHHLEHEVVLLGYLSPRRLDAYYSNCNLVVLTSHSEGIPLALMEAMARRRLVLAPAITGIPELVVDGETGFLYRPGCVNSFISKIEEIRDSPTERLERILNAARVLVVDQYNRKTNLSEFANLLLQRLPMSQEINPHENCVLQQI